MPQPQLLLHDYLDYLGRSAPDTEFACFGERRMSYGEALLETNRLANALRAAGLRRGSRFAYLSKNSIDMIIAYLAGSKTGAVPVPLNYRLAPAEWAYIIADSAAELVIAQSRYADALDPVRSDLGRVRHFVAIDGAARAEWLDYRQWLRDQSDDDPCDHGSDEDTLYQMYTSGTTGRPKGAMISQRAVLANLNQSRYCVETPCRRGMRFLICTPMYHAAGAIFVCASVAAGAAIVIHEDFKPAAVAAALRNDRIAGTNLVPSMIQSLLVDVPDLAEHAYDDLISISYGASPIAEDTLRRALAVFKCEFYQAFGLTESTAALTMLDNTDHQRALAGRPELLRSAGRAVMGTELRIVDDLGRPVPCGQLGEIIARGPQIMDGYWNMPEATAQALRGGWLYTGDIGSIDEDGYLYIQDRKKDVIVSGAENVYPQEVENVLFGHPDISDVAVIGVPDDQYGEAVMAFIVARDGRSLDTEEIIAFCRGRLGGFKIPRRMQFVSALPRNASGKVLKNELRAPFWSGRERRVS